MKQLFFKKFIWVFLVGTHGYIRILGDSLRQKVAFNISNVLLKIEVLFKQYL